MNLKDAYQLLHNGSLALAKVEANGIRIDTDRLQLTIEEVSERIKNLSDKFRNSKEFTEWRKIHGDKTNPNSGDQLAKTLIKMGFEWKEITKTGKPKTNEATLEKLNNKFVRRFLRLKKLKHFKSTSLEGLKREIVNGYFHAIFNLHTAKTYRSSSGGSGNERANRDYNFQNLPIRDPEFGELIRKCFIPRKGHVFVEVDYSALEFRIAACFWKDPAMVEYASDPKKDIHRDLAAKCYMLKKEEVSKETRYVGKNGFVFPYLYGSYYVKIAQAMWREIEAKKLTGPNGIPLKEHLKSKGIYELGECNPRKAWKKVNGKLEINEDDLPKEGTFEKHIKDVQDWFDKKFPVFTEKKKKWIEDYRKTGSFQMTTGFVSSGLLTNNDLLNHPIQGPGFHCLLWSLIQIQKEIELMKLESKIVGQIHDCLVIDVPVKEIQKILDLCERVMTITIRKEWPWIIVPMGVEADVTPEGTSWHDKKPWKKVDGVWQPV